MGGIVRWARNSKRSSLAALGAAIVALLCIASAPAALTISAGVLAVALAAICLATAFRKPDVRRWKLVAVSALALGLMAACTAAVNGAASTAGGNADLTATASATTAQVGLDPVGVVATPDSRYAYVSNFRDGTVSAVDLSSETAVATIPVGSGPDNVAVSPDGSRVYVANFGAGQVVGQTVSVIDTFTRAVVGTISGLHQPNSIALSADGTQAYVTNLQNATVSVVDTGTDTVVFTIPVAAGPQEVAATPDGRYLYVTTSGADIQSGKEVTIVDLRTGQPVKHLEMDATPNGVGTSPDGRRAFVTLRSGSLAIIDTSTNTVVKSVALGSAGQASPFEMAVPTHGSDVYVANWGDQSVAGKTVTKVDTASGAVSGYFQVPESPGGIAVTSDGTRLITTVDGGPQDGSGNTISILKLR